MPEPQPPGKNIGSTKPTQINLPHSIAKLEAEIRHNQQRIEQLQQQNTRLTHKIRAMSRKRPSNLDATGSNRIADRRRPKRYSPQRFWLSITVMCVCIVVVSSVIGFAVMRLLSFIK